MKYCKKCKIAAKESDTVCPKCKQPVSSFGSATAAPTKPAAPRPAVTPTATPPTAGPKPPPSPKSPPPPCAGATATAGSPKSPTFTLAGQIAELQVIKQKNLKRGRNLGILSLLAALAIMFLIYSVYSRTVLAYAVLENIEIEQDPDAETQITVSFDVKIPGMVAFDRRSGTGHTEKLDMITVAEHRGTVWSWPSDPKTGIDFSVVSRGGWFRTRMDKHFRIHGEEVTPEDDGRTVLEAGPDPDRSTAPTQVVAAPRKKDEKRKPAGCLPFKPGEEKPKSPAELAAIRQADIDRGQSVCASSDPAEIAQIVGEVAPGFTARLPVIQGGVAISAEHFGRQCVLSTHPLDPFRPCILTSTLRRADGQADLAHVRRIT